MVDELRTCSLAELQDAIEYIYLSGEVPRDDLQDSKTFLILRALFAVPTSESISVAKSFGGWVRPELFLTSTPSQVNLLWPLTLNTADQVTGVASYMGYTGTWYDAVGEFAWFRTSTACADGHLLTSPAASHARSGWPPGSSGQGCLG
ncbi:MAG: hypothetical protein R3F60_24135 [bacterium]